ncbi:SE1832 family protein [Camelliibacillus cellulosilyticus]|uniref:SE1832 family protein n=1 Tax=Camelliibacillus cellulosilyticus TaxID=2174486 RepID=UPI00366F884A
MNKEELQTRIYELKMDYARLQGDLEKMHAFRRDTSHTEQVLIDMENELKTLRKQLAEMD